jgi:hypothetical protein
VRAREQRSAIASTAITLFSDEQLVALSNVFERAIFAAASAMSAVSSTMTATLPTPTPIAGVPLSIRRAHVRRRPGRDDEIGLPHQLERPSRA